MQNLLDAFIEYAKENKMSYTDLATQLEHLAITQNVMDVKHYPMMDGILKRTISRNAPDGRIDTFVKTFSYLGFSLLPGIGKKKIQEIENLMLQLNLTWGVTLDNITADTNLDTLGLSKTWTEKLKSQNVCCVGSFLAHPRIGIDGKVMLRKFM